MIKIQKNIFLAPYTTFKIGGYAKYFAEPKDLVEIRDLSRWAKNKDISVFVLGGGSNILFSDNGFGGLVMRVQNLEFEVNGLEIVTGAAVPLAKLFLESVRLGLSGLEWAVGIPGTIGGAVAGNAGAFGKSIADAVKSVEVFDVEKLEVVDYKIGDCGFAYRDSIFKNNSNLIINRVTLRLRQEELCVIRERIKEYAEQRATSFAQNQKCAGCFFKNIEWKGAGVDKKYLLKKFPELKQFASKSKIPAGFLIEFLGFKNKKMGEAMVFDQHANFILNTNNATAEHIIMLTGLIKNKIYSRYGFVLEEEVQLIGFD
ncbi:MAG: UDP-N-acetylmuramate dehydrogenase [Patescibacteria group bacterium]